MKWDSPEWREGRDKIISQWFLGDIAAIEFLRLLSSATELWDDLIDGDKRPLPQEISQVFTDLLVGLPNNPFYMQHRQHLTPLIIQAINSWQVANVLETGAPNERALAYTLRNMDIQIVQAIVYIIQGPARAREIAPMLWRLFAADQDDAAEWIFGAHK